MKVFHYVFPALLLTLFTYSGSETVYRSTGTPEHARLIRADERSVILEFNLPELTAVLKELPEFGKGTFFRVPGYTEGHYKVGMPDVPVARHRVRVPNTGKVVLDVVSEETELLGSFRVVPFQMPQTHNGEVFPYEINSKVYATSQYYPLSAAEISSVEILRDIRIAQVWFNPVRVNPVSGDVLIVKNARVRLTVTGEKGMNELRRRYQGVTRSYIPFYKDVLNMDQELLRRRAEVGCYLFLGTSQTLTAVEDLINWKKRKGYDVVVADVDTVGSSSSAIDSWIEDAYNNWENPPEYLFIIGDEDDVPPPSTGSYEADNKFGVVGSGNNPSIHVGRITAKDGSVDNLTYQAWKILKHEMEPYEGVWCTTGETWGCQSPNGEPSASKWAGILEDGGMTVTIELEAQGGAKGAELVGHFNEGLCTFGYKGHGSYSSMSSASLSVNIVAGNIDNGRMLSWINNIGCNCSNFSGRYCIAEAWMCEGSIQDPKGALGTFAFTVSSLVGSSDNLLSGIYEALMGEDPELWHIGAACDYGKTKASSSSDINGGMLWGCPETMLCTVNPIPQLQASHTAPERGDFSITITDGTSPVEGALIGIVKKDSYEHLGAGYTDAAGKLTLTIPDVSGDVYVTATCRNYKPYLYEGPTAISGSNVAVSGFTLGRIYPNPVRSSAIIRYTLPGAGEVTFDVITMNGSTVYSRTSEVPAGSHAIFWGGTGSSGKEVPNGVYLYRLMSKYGARIRSCTVMR